VALLKTTNSLADKCTHLVIDDFCALRNKEVVRVVLTESLVGRCCEADNRLSSGVTDINTDEHGARGFNDLGELHGEEISAYLTVHLTDDVGSLGGIE